jgi:hypothetical protein
VCRRIFLAFLLLAALAFAGLAFVVYDVTRPDARGKRPQTPATAPPAAENSPPGPQSSGEPGTAPQPPVPPPSEPERSARRTAKRLAVEIKGAPKAGAPQDDGRFEVTITDGELNEMVTSLPEVRMALEKQHINAPEIRFEPDRLVANARVPVYGGVEARVSLAGRVRAQDGKLVYETESVSIGSFPAPGPVRDELDKQIKKAVEGLDKSLKGRVEEVTLSEGSLLVRGTRE